MDAIESTFAEVRENISVLRNLYPGLDDMHLAHAVMIKCNTYHPESREAHLLGLVGTVLHFASKRARKG